MKLLLENWRKYLKEGTENSSLHIFFDMDGVLVDLVATLAKKMNENLSSLEPDKVHAGNKKGIKILRKLKALVTEVTPKQLEEITRKKDAGEERTPEERAINNYVYVLLGDETGQIWLDMKVAPGAQEMIDAAKEKGSIYVISSPVGPVSVEKKKEWLDQHFPDAPFVDKIFSSEKGQELKDTGIIQRGETAILIDDRLKYKEQFEAAGGQVIYHYPPATSEAVSNTLNALGEL
tara:strand:- start:1010 stop:1711 length:702 start_codon:yes stop_codon:yes gene_type:complete